MTPEPNRESRLPEATPSATPGAFDARMILMWAIAAGVATGLIEALWLAYRRHVLGRMIYQGMHFFWLAPVTNLVIFLLLGCVLALVWQLAPPLRRPRLVVWLLLFIMMMGLRSIGPRIHAAAWLVLAAGVATTLSGPLTGTSPVARTWLRRSAWAAVLITALLTLGGVYAERHGERAALARLPDAAPGAPSVLLIVMDTVPAKRMSLYGYAQPTTPQLEAFAKSAVVFNRCISPSPWTLPSHASMFTGIKPPDQSGGWLEPFVDSDPTLAERLQEQGYATAGFGANTYYLPAEFGLGRGFGRYRAPRKLLLQAIESSQLAKSIANRTILPVFRGRVVGQKSAEDINRECLSWLNEQPAGRPFFVFLNYIDTHGPYAPPREFAEKFGLPESHTMTPSVSLLSRPDVDEQLRLLTKTYEACLAYVDDQVGQLLARLKADGRLDNTLVIITSDHGEQLGENGVVGHGNSLYLPQIHVPLLVSFPGRLPEGQRVDSLVSLLDLPATVAELVPLPRSAAFPGTSFVPRMTGASTPTAEPIVAAQVSPKPPERVDRFELQTPLGKGEIRSALSPTFHYILNGDGSEELYRYVDDADETENLVEQPDLTDELERLRAAIADWHDERTGGPGRADSN